MSKKFVMMESDRSEIPKMLEISVSKYLKDDGYDHLRKKVWHSQITEGEFESALLDLEQTISFMKKGNDINLNCTFNKLGNGPLEDRVIIWPDKTEQVTASGIHIPQSQQARPAQGTVISVGPGLPNRMHNELIGYFKEEVIHKNFIEGATPLYKLISMPLKPGDKVLFGRLAGLPIKDPETGTEGYLVMRLSDIFVKI